MASLSKPAVQARWVELLSNDEVWICDQVAMEVVYSARNAADYDRTAGNLDGFRVALITPEVFKRARAIQAALAHAGGMHHRSVTIADLVIASAAEAAGLTVLHYDEDYDRIAAITNQPTEWIAPRGSL